MITACIVTYQSREEVGGALRSLEKAAAQIALRAYVVDNASTDGVREMIRADFPFVTLIENADNRGFGRANNQMLPLIDSDYHLLLNPDITFEAEQLQKMAAYLDTHPETVALTPRVLNPDGTEQRLPKHAPTLRFLMGGFLQNKAKVFAKWRERYTGGDLDLSRPAPVDFATGCFLLVRTSVFKKIKGFDERFFMYLEDTDLSLRLLKEGQILYHPDMYVTHAWKRGSHSSLKGIGMHVRSAFIFFNKWGWRL